MHYVDVLVGEASYHGGAALTYGSETPLPTGSLVYVPLRNKKVLGLVSGKAANPSFAVKPVEPIDGLSPLPASLLSLLAWMQGYYPAPLGIITQLFLPSQLPKEMTTLELTATTPKELPPLTPEQQAAIAQMQGPGLHLLHGETGSGKTRVYIELARRSLAASKSVIILSPEIGLTSQLVAEVKKIFGDRVITMHSQLGDATRRKRWQQILTATEPLIVIGARSALFSPLQSVGLIVVDEMHETAYKQDQAPYYHTTPVAAKLASLHGATLVLGSATPLVSDYYVAEAKKRPIVRMLQLAKANQHEPVSSQVVDLRKREDFTSSPHLSAALVKAMKEVLARGEQTLLFLNRRGTARIVFCETCGWQSTCPHCDLPLVYHGDSHMMRCHTCAYKTSSPTSCPSCGSASVVYKSIGTKAIASEVERLFPEARIMRFDTDNKKSERIEQHYDKVKNGEVDIVIGTQTLAKGLDLPNLSLVGVIVADTSLYFPDFSAQERTYQLLTQVLGRVGRGHRAGQTIVQTYDPENPTLAAALTKDWETFYTKEIEERRLFRFPPFCFLLKLTCKRASSSAAQQTAEQFAETLRRSGRSLAIEGPTPSFHEKMGTKYAWQLVVKTKQRSDLTAIIRDLPSGWSYDIDPMNLL